MHWQAECIQGWGGVGSGNRYAFGFIGDTVAHVRLVCLGPCGGFENIEHCLLETFFWMWQAWEHDLAAGLLLVILGYTAKCITTWSACLYLA